MKSVLLSIVLLVVSANATSKGNLLVLEYEFSRGGELVASWSSSVQEGRESSYMFGGQDVASFSLSVTAETREDGSVFLTHEITYGEDQLRPALLVEKGSESSIQVGDLLLKVIASDKGE